VLGLVLASFLPQVAMRGTAQEAVKGYGEGFAVPANSDSDSHLETVIGRIMRQHPQFGEEVLARTRVDVDIPTVWGLLAVNLRERVLKVPTRQQDVEDRVGVPHGVLTSFFDGLARHGYVLRIDDTLQLTDRGEAVISRMLGAWREWLLEQLHDWLPGEDEAELAPRARAAVERIARRALAEQEHEALAPTRGRSLVPAS
jgi:hypothetical protein